MKSSIRRFWERLDGPVHPAEKPLFKKNKNSFNLDFPPPAFIGDLENAPIVILMANGGYNTDRISAQFSKFEDIEEYIDYLVRRRPEFPKGLSSYYTNNDWLQNGTAVLVTAVAYRSPRISAERDNSKLARILPSSLQHRRWRIDEVLPAARDNSRMVVAHRHRLWELDRPALATHPNFLFSTNPASKYLSEETRDRVNHWMKKRRSNL